MGFGGLQAQEKASKVEIEEKSLDSCNEKKKKFFYK